MHKKCTKWASFKYRTPISHDFKLITFHQRKISAIESLPIEYNIKTYMSVKNKKCRTTRQNAICELTLASGIPTVILTLTKIDSPCPHVLQKPR